MELLEGGHDSREAEEQRRLHQGFVELRADERTLARRADRGAEQLPVGWLDGDHAEQQQARSGVEIGPVKIDLHVHARSHTGVVLFAPHADRPRVRASALRESAP